MTQVSIRTKYNAGCITRSNVHNILQLFRFESGASRSYIILFTSLQNGGEKNAESYINL